MALSVETLALAKGYTDESVAGGGAIKGKNCTIESITPITGGNEVTFKWTLDDGTEQTDTMDVMDGEDGKGIKRVYVNEEDHLIIVYDDDTTSDAGEIVVQSSVDSVNGKTGEVVLDASDVGALPDDTTIPSKTSDLTNDSNFVADASYVHTDNNYDATAKGIVDGVTTALSGKVDKNGTDSLMTADEHTKLSGIAAGAEVNVQSDWEEANSSSDAYIANKPNIPTKTSDLTNDSGFIANTVNDLVNYYTKTQTYTQSEVDSLISAIVTLNISVVAQLPTTNISTTTIYLVPSADPQTQNVKDEYINLDGTTAGWEMIGSTAIDLTNYVTDDDLTTALADYVTSTSLSTTLADYVQKSQTAGLLKNDGTVDPTSYATESSVTAILDGQSIDSFGDVETALAGKADTSDIPDITGKADKVSNATSGNFAGLDSNGNLTDSGKSASDFATGTDIQDRIKETVGWTGRNLYNKATGKANTIVTQSGESTSSSYSSYNASDYIEVNANTQYYIQNGTGVQTQHTACVYDSSKAFLRYVEVAGLGVQSGIINTGADAKYIRLNVRVEAIDTCMLSKGSDTNVTYEPYHKNVEDSKADKVTSATNGNLAGLDANGNLTDSGYASSDFARNDDFGGVTSGSQPGHHGLVPTPPTGYPDRYLRSNGSWSDLPTPDYVDAQYNSSTTYSKGMTCISGNVRYRYKNSTASSGHQPPNATYWEVLSVSDEINKEWTLFGTMPDATLRFVEIINNNIDLFSKREMKIAYFDGRLSKQIIIVPIQDVIDAMNDSDWSASQQDRRVGTYGALLIRVKDTNGIQFTSHKVVLDGSGSITKGTESWMVTPCAKVYVR